MVNRDRIRDKIQSMRTNLQELRSLANMPESEFVASKILFHASTRMLQISIEAALDIAQHIVARKQLGTPKTYREAVLLLEEAGVIPADQVPSLVNMTKFRNRVVHMYDEVSREEVYRIITQHLTDFDRFIESVVRFAWADDQC